MIIVVNGLRSGEGGGEGKEIAPGRFFLREMRSLQGYVRMYDSYFFFRGLKVREKQRKERRSKKSPTHMADNLPYSLNR